MRIPCIWWKNNNNITTESSLDTKVQEKLDVNAAVAINSRPWCCDGRSVANVSQGKCQGKHNIRDSQHSGLWTYLVSSQRLKLGTALFAVLFSFLFRGGPIFGGCGILPRSRCDTIALIRSIKSLDYAMGIAAKMLQVSHGNIMGVWGIKSTLLENVISWCWCCMMSHG